MKNPFSWFLDKLTALVDSTAQLPEVSEDEMNKSKEYFEEAAKQLEEREDAERKHL